MYNNILNFFALLLFYQYICLIYTSCPPDQIIKPCSCVHETPYDDYLSYSSFTTLDISVRSIVCEHIYDSSFDIRAVFSKLSSYSKSIINKDKNATRYNYFILSNTTIRSFPENVFVDIIFRSIHLRNDFQLTTIHPNTFSYGKEYVESFETINTSLSDSERIFSILRQFQNLRYLSMHNDQLKSIPSYAFNHTYLSHISFGSEYPKQTQPIESIGDYAFYNLPSLSFVRILSPNLTKITKYAFALRKRVLSLDYSSNFGELGLGGEGLNSNSFELTSLNRFRNHQVLLRFYHTSLTYLDENIFQPFLEANPSSAIDIGSTNSLFGCDYRSGWILKDYFTNDNNFISRVYGYNYQCKYDFPKN